MALKITLAPHERMIIGGAVITNGPGKAEFLVENKVPILRRKNILSPKEASSPARRIYLAIQLMYVDSEHLPAHHQIYWDLVRDFVAAAPSSIKLVDMINEAILQGDYYQALKSTRKLIEFEQEAIERVQQRC